MNRILTQLVWVMVAIVVLIAILRVATTRTHRSNDRQILIEKSKQRN